MEILEDAAFARLEELGNEIFSGSALQGTLILFMNNLMSTMYVIFLGLIIGIPSMLSALANGSVLGLLSYQLSQQGISPLPYFAAGILPHGIFELPAFFISVALGLKLGYHIVFPLSGRSRMDSLRTIFGEIRTSLPFIVILLAVAAVIEIFVTPHLLVPFL